LFDLIAIGELAANLLLGLENDGQFFASAQMSSNPRQRGDDSTTIRRAAPRDRTILVDMWLRSMRATHSFPSEQDIQGLIAPATEYLMSEEPELWVLHMRSAARKGEPVHQFHAEIGEDAPGIIAFLEDRLYEHNSRKIASYDGQLFSRVVRDPGGGIVGAAAGWTWSGACEITQLWVAESVRSKGIGRMLLHAAEEEARSKRCSMILVKTYSFQAPSFYLRHGYRTEHVIDGFPAGHGYYTLTKKLNGGPPGEG
jgi:GNAT superfamily N-acetyltransferase